MHKRLLAIGGFAALAFLALSSTVCAASRSESATYVDGNVNGLEPNTGGTLLFSDDNTMVFRTGLATVPVSYAAITHSELGAVRETSHDVPVYKVWKRFGGKTQTQLLIVNFKNEQGEEKSMTLELAKASAPGVFSAIQSHSPAETAVASNAPSAAPATERAEKPAKAEKTAKADTKKADMMATKPAKESDPWWGDDYWKTSRNTDKWNQKADRTELEKSPQEHP